MCIRDRAGAPQTAAVLGGNFDTGSAHQGEEYVAGQLPRGPDLLPRGESLRLSPPLPLQQLRCRAP
eukprot:7215974-Alexandrium_andersonii.AAC.1